MENMSDPELGKMTAVKEQLLPSIRCLLSRNLK